MKHAQCSGPTILAGDYNFLARSQTYARITSHLQDVQSLAASQQSSATFPARYPRFRIDYIFASPAIEVERVEAIRTSATQVASDHLPVVADLRIPITVASSQDLLQSRTRVLDHV